MQTRKRSLDPRRCRALATLVLGLSLASAGSAIDHGDPGAAASGSEAAGGRGSETAARTTAGEVTTSVQTAEPTVFLTWNWKSFHELGCPLLVIREIPVPLSEALEGYRPCLQCRARRYLQVYPPQQSSWVRAWKRRK